MLKKGGSGLTAAMGVSSGVGSGCAKIVLVSVVVGSVCRGRRFLWWVAWAAEEGLGGVSTGFSRGRKKRHAVPQKRRRNNRKGEEKSGALGAGRGFVAVRVRARCASAAPFPRTFPRTGSPPRCAPSAQGSSAPPRPRRAAVGGWRPPSCCRGLFWHLGW